MMASTVESSTYFQREVVSLRALLIKIRKSSGPTQVPWETPQMRGRKVQVASCMYTVRPDNGLGGSSRITIHPRIPFVAVLLMAMVWSTRSNALLKSTSVVTTEVLRFSKLW